ncbi:type II toxin-antitoxin system VapB family antitoxin [Serinicoccus hydrothermalis]|nr:type II toxin-antitoxin system VapB family antitoxin [Serinicoccus hydrothermalis]
MSLNIKNPRVHDLARQAAARTGRSQTSVIELALRQLLDGLPTEDVASGRTRVDAILADLDLHLGRHDLTLLDHDDLYDDAGLPT